MAVGATISNLGELGGRCAKSALVLFAMSLFWTAVAEPITIRAKSDLRLWETVTDRARPLSWSWEFGADAAELTFSNRLTQAVSSVTVPRTAGALRGACDHPMTGTTGEGLVVATLVQTAGGVEIARETAELAYVPGVAGGASASPMTVRTMANRDWLRVRCPRLAAFDARWWDKSGPSGYEVLWVEPPGSHAVVRAFEGVGVVDEVMLKFGMPGFWLIYR